MRMIVTVAAMIAAMASPAANAVERFRCPMGDTGTLTVAIDPQTEQMTIAQAAGAALPVCAWLLSIVTDDTKRAAIAATQAACRTSIDKNVVITDWPIQAAQADMSVIAVLDRKTREFAFYGRRSRDNFMFRGQCTAL